jgi:hypothetical protein
MLRALPVASWYSSEVPRASIVPVPVPRGPSLASCSTAIAAAAVAEPVAREQREEAAQQRREEAWRAAMQRPQSIALTLPPKING